MRTLLIILGVLAILATLTGAKAAQIGALIAFGKAAQKAGPPPEAVSAAPVGQETWEGTLTAVGSVVGAKGVSLSADAPGRVRRLHFESGARVRQGQLLVELDTDTERGQLESARARQKLAALQLERTRVLVKGGSLAPAQLDADESAYQGAGGEVDALKAQIGRKTIRAPFSGRLGIRAVNVGQYLAPGTPITGLESTEAAYVDFALPQQYLGKVRPGMPVRALQGEEREVIAEGTLSAIDPTVDLATRTVKIRAEMPNRDERLRSGMFVTAQVVLPERLKVLAVPVTAIVHAPYGDSVFVLEPKRGPGGAPAPGPDGKPPELARQQFVRLGETRGDFVAVLEGLSPGQRVVTSGAFKLRSGAPVVVDNRVDLHPKLVPHPPNR